MCIRDRYQRRVHGETNIKYFMKVLLLAFLALSFVAVSADNWAVLVAGSDGFWNYRHQADICHAYHILLNNGYKPENIIVFSSNDIAKSSENPFPGQLFNKPTGEGEIGVDVNAGCVIDYEGYDVFPRNFLAVLRGEAETVEGGTEKVLGSTHEDRVFIYFADHGAQGLISFPTYYLFADDLIKTFQYMHENKMYSELVFYLEACESGSMFQKLPKDWKIYATSAASPYESSWAYYCTPDDKVNGKNIGSCLGDHYSISWMEDTERGDLTETLNDQYEIVKKRVTKSQVLEWGELGLNVQPIGNYHANGFQPTTINRLKAQFLRKMVSFETARGIDSRDVKLHYLNNRHQIYNNLESSQALRAEINERLGADHKFAQLSKYFNFPAEDLLTQTSPEDFNCLKESVTVYEQTCGKFSDYSLKYVQFLVNVCEKRRDLPKEEILAGIATVCARMN
eukprot:TRINITY_DN1287_c0_g1_i2.p1 TRINITY_DN1287_c0_g1~~TRINITY_DN1287_c0_g1_i2.p1  ORF type:complete len:453 (-),score=124.91 TRINITY_DN1287_c0_g1_i2:127-1485(-)